MSKISKNQAKNHAIKQQFAQTTPLYPLSNAQFTPKKHLKTQYHFSSKNESGRSMVEMLGVLAVIGVLSIGGIQGYTYAMNKYNANQTVNELNLINAQLAAWVLSPHENGGEMILGEPYDDGHMITSAYAFDYGCGVDTTSNEPCDVDETGYYFIIENIPENVCRQMAQMTTNMQFFVEQHINNVPDETGEQCQAENNRVVLFYDIEEAGLPLDPDNPPVYEPDPEETVLPEYSEPELPDDWESTTTPETTTPEPEETEMACPYGGASAGLYEAEVRMSDLQFNDGDLAATITCGLYTQGVSYTIGLTINISPSVEGAGGPTRDELKAMDWSSIKQFCSDYMTNTPFSNGGMTWSPEGGGKSYYIGGRKEKNFAGGYTEEPIAVHHSCEI